LKFFNSSSYLSCWWLIIFCFGIAEEDGIVDISVVPLSESEVELAIHGILKKESVNTTSRLEKLRFQPCAKSKINNLLCRMISLPVVHPYLKNDVMNLAAHFVACRYMEGNVVFYVALENNEGKTMVVTPDIIASWSDHWVQANAQFEKELSSDDDLRVFSRKMFMVWDGNHRLQAWLPIINNEHQNDPSWHYAVESIILIVKGDVVGMLTALHEVNWYVMISSLIQFLLWSICELYWIIILSFF
jgi:hypothetical protein